MGVLSGGDLGGEAWASRGPGAGAGAGPRERLREFGPGGIPHKPSRAQPLPPSYYHTFLYSA